MPRRRASNPRTAGGVIAAAPVRRAAGQVQKGSTVARAPLVSSLFLLWCRSSHAANPARDLCRVGPAPTARRTLCALSEGLVPPLRRGSSRAALAHTHTCDCLAPQVREASGSHQRSSPLCRTKHSGDISTETLHPHSATGSQKLWPESQEDNLARRQAHALDEVTARHVVGRTRGSAVLQNLSVFVTLQIWGSLPEYRSWMFGDGAAQECLCEIRLGAQYLQDRLSSNSAQGDPISQRCWPWAPIIERSSEKIRAPRPRTGQCSLPHFLVCAPSACRATYRAGRRWFV